MTTQTITPLSAGFVTAGGSMTGNNSTDGSASFADLLASVSADAGSAPSPQEIRAAAKAHMMQRIAQVGFAQYIQEQQQETKMMRVLSILEAEAPNDKQPPNVKSVLTGIQYDFERNPPDGLQDMYARIDKAVGAISPDAPDHLLDQMKVVEQEIRQMMNEPDDALAQRAQADGLTAALPG